MTLKEFAAAQGLNYESAKKKRQRGQIVSDGDGWRLNGDDGDNSPEIMSPNEGTTGDNNDLSPTDWPERDTLPARDSDIECAGCAALREQLADALARIETLEAAQLEAAPRLRQMERVQHAGVRGYAGNRARIEEDGEHRERERLAGGEVWIA